MENPPTGPPRVSCSRTKAFSLHVWGCFHACCPQFLLLLASFRHPVMTISFSFTPCTQTTHTQGRCSQNSPNPIRACSFLSPSPSISRPSILVSLLLSPQDVWRSSLLPVYLSDNIRCDWRGEDERQISLAMRSADILSILLLKKNPISACRNTFFC